ncbi:Hypothetical protein PHPALM_7729 [Phytophthora palmivora]|uniref:Uncharacterized protein n=1 Tax=Phytophthora palmivora TaxID=4796 RepID=A0A2P4YBL5_9STRA|nr:Hypothetical protein PHPALM_7729 [Phytophthora palmivora]
MCNWEPGDHIGRSRFVRPSEAVLLSPGEEFIVRIDYGPTNPQREVVWAGRGERWGTQFIELAAVWGFLNDATIDEIVGGGLVTASDAASFLKSAFESSVVVFSGESSPSNSSIASSNSDDDMTSSTKRPKKLEMSKDQRERQKGYDKKYRMKKDGKRVEAAKAFVAGLKLLNLLLEDRVQRTRRVSATKRLLLLNKDDQKFPDYDRDLQMITQEAKTQLGLNQAATTYIELWTATWTLSKIEKGKFFLRSYVVDIEAYIEGLVNLGEQLAECTAELEWCMDREECGFSIDSV